MKTKEKKVTGINLSRARELEKIFNEHLMMMMERSAMWERKAVYKLYNAMVVANNKKILELKIS